MYYNALIGIPEQLKAWIDAKKDMLIGPGFDLFPDISEIEVFDYMDINIVTQVSSGIYIQFVEASSPIHETHMEYTFVVVYVEQYGDAKTRDIVSRKRAQSLYRILMAYQPSIGVITSITMRRGAVSVKHDPAVMIITVKYMLPSRLVDIYWNK